MTAPPALPDLDLFESDGQPAALAGTDMDGAFAYWRGVSGQRYLFHVLTADREQMAARSLKAVLLLAAREADGGWIALWLGPGEDDGFEEALRMARRKRDVSVHVYGQAAEDRDRLAVINDLAGRMAPFRSCIPPMLAGAA